MPIRTELKFSRYVKNVDSRNMPAEKILDELKEQAEKLSLKGTEMKLLADDFIGGSRINICLSGITNGSITPYHNHDFYEINYVVSGECVQYIEGGSIIMKQGDLLFMPPEAFHAPCPVGDSVCINILMRKNWFYGMEERLKDCDQNNYLTFLRKGRIYMLFRDISANRAGKTVDVLLKEVKDALNYASLHGIYIESIVSKLLIELSECTRFDTLFSEKSHSVGAESPDISLRLYDYVAEGLKKQGLTVKKGVFGADMKINQTNDGPFTVILEKGI
jgi:D-tyrosyl-tRNA(Tyr) deacylase